MSSCSYCGGPVSGAGLAGRPWPGREPASYCCYGCLSLGEQDRQADAAPAAAGWKLDGLGMRLAAALLVVGQSMIFGLALNLHDDVPATVRWFTQNLLLGATALVFALLGGPLVRAAWAELRRGRVTIEALFLVTAAGATAASLQAHLTGRGKIYFEVVSILLVVYTLGKVVGARARAAALAGARAWAGQLATARVVDAAGRSRTIPVTEVVPGDLVEVFPGETVPVDGVIRAGTGYLSEAPVSGEPFAVVRRPGDRVLAGVAAHDATFRVEATAAGTDRQVDHLLKAVEAARAVPLSVQNRADRLSRVFVPLVIATAAATFGYWALLTRAGWEAAQFHATSVLLVACPCVLGLATPVIVWSVLARLAERGLVVRSGDAIERLAAVDTVLLDKTGTLTDNRFALVDIETVAEGEERARLLGWVSLVEGLSRHPVAAPFAKLPRPFPPGAEPRVERLTAVPGCGVEAELADADGTRRTLRIGRVGWVEHPDHDNPATSHDPARLSPPPLGEGPGEGLTTLALLAGWRGNLTPPAPLSRGERGGTNRTTASRFAEATGHTIAVSVKGELAAVAVVAERLRDSAAAALADFDRLGLPVEVLTGDTADRAAALGLPAVSAGMLPADKQARVEALAAAGRRPLMVGDGINDAAALAASHARVALASGTDLAVSAADATLYHGDLRVLPWAVELSRAAVAALRRSLAGAVAYNLVGMALAAAGVLHPVVAVLLMVASSVTLVALAARVGVRRGHCNDVVPPLAAVQPRRKAASGKSVVHGAALALQGVLALALLEPLRAPLPAALTLGAFTLAGALLALWWHRRLNLSHGADMAFGMLTAGNLGMLLGWWADAGFAPLYCAHCSCGDPLAKPWMWLGMLLAANAAMLWLGRRPLPDGDHAAAMFTGGNAGMLAGMMAGGKLAAGTGAEDVVAAAALAFAGMTAGMVGGMLLGTWLVEQASAALRRARRFRLRMTNDPPMTHQ